MSACGGVPDGEKATSVNLINKHKIEGHRMPKFIPGLKLSELFYKEVIQLLMESHFPNVAYSAALIGYGSEVLGLDTPLSTDHEWGPRLRLFLSEDDYEICNEKITDCLRNKLPHSFKGFSTSFSLPDEEGTTRMEKNVSRPVNHKIYIHTIKSYIEWKLGIDPFKEIEVHDWLTFPEQMLLEITAGKVFYDGLNQLNVIREKLSYYPHDVWLYLLSVQWDKIAEEEAFVGRSGDIGDELGSSVIAAGIVGKLMKLCFLMERKYAPYSKWLGSAFSKLACSEKLDPIFKNVLRSTSWKEREKHLVEAYRVVGELHNGLRITDPVDAAISPYYNRPYLAIHAGRFANEIRKAIENKELQGLKFKIGSVNQFISYSEVLEYPPLFRKAKLLFV